MERDLIHRILAVALVTGACNDPAAPALKAGVYQLVAIDGAPPPALRWTTPQCDKWVTDASLTIGPSDSAYLYVHDSLDCTRAGGGVTVGTRFYQGTVFIRGYQLTFGARSEGAPVTLAGSFSSAASEVNLDDEGDYVGGPGILKLTQQSRFLSSALPNQRMELAAPPF